MAWGAKYKTSFINQLGETIETTFSFKGYVGGITTLVSGGNPLQINYLNNSEDIFEPIIGCQAIVEIYVKDGAVSFDDFVTTEDDEIYVSILKDNAYKIFDGFVIAEEGSQTIHDDAPYTISISCTDALGLLKGIPFTDQSGNKFKGRNTIIKYITAALYRANPNINVRSWCDIYAAFMFDRGASIFNDMMIQAKLDARMFQKDARDFLDCYEVLTKIAANHFIIFYHLGTYNVLRVADLQRTTMHFTEFAPDGTTVIDGGEGDSINAKIGRDQNIGSIHADNEQSLMYARKRVKLSYTYKSPENLVNNQKLTELGAFIAPVNGYAVDGWTQKHKDIYQQTNISHVVPYIKVELNAFAYEIDRYIVIPADVLADSYPTRNYIINDNDNFFVDKDDHLSFSITYRYNNDMGDSNSTDAIMIMGIKKDGTDGTHFADWFTATTGGGWISTSGQQIGINLVGQNSSEWRTISFDTVIPGNGILYLCLGIGDNVPAGNEIHYKDIQFTYTPQIRGGYISLKGDYNKDEQTQNYKNSVDEDVFVSDAPKRILEGALFETDGTLLADPTWYRYGTSEQKRYTALVALGYYNLRYRKFRKIVGSFKGFNYERRTGEYIPFGLMTKFEFTEIGDGRQYMCVNPRMNLKTGQWTGTMIEVYKDSGDGSQTPPYEFNYTF